MMRVTVIIVIVLSIMLALGVLVFVMRPGGGSRSNPALIPAIGASVSSFAFMAAIGGVRRSNGSRRRLGRAETAANDFGLSYLAKADKSFRSQFGELPELPRNATVKQVMSGSRDG